MTQKEATAQVPEKKDSEGNVTQKQLGPITVLVNYPETLEEAQSWTTEAAILSNAFAHWKVNQLQSGIRTGLKAGKTQEEIQAMLGNSVMGVAREGARVDPVDAYAAMFATATPDKQAEMLADLQARAEAQANA